MPDLFTAIDWIAGLLFAGAMAMTTYKEMQSAKVMIWVAVAIVALRWGAWEMFVRHSWYIRAAIGALLGGVLFAIIPAALSWIGDNHEPGQAHAKAQSDISFGKIYVKNGGPPSSGAGIYIGPGATDTEIKGGTIEGYERGIENDGKRTKIGNPKIYRNQRQPQQYQYKGKFKNLNNSNLRKKALSLSDDVQSTIKNGDENAIKASAEADQKFSSTQDQTEKRKWFRRGNDQRDEVLDHTNETVTNMYSADLREICVELQVRLKQENRYSEPESSFVLEYFNFGEPPGIGAMGLADYVSDMAHKLT